MFRCRASLPGLLLFTGIGTLIVAWTAVVLVDVVGSQPEIPLWARLFTEQGPIEVVQWTLLLAGVVVCMWGMRAERSPGERFLTVMAFALVLMFAEDFANVSHLVRSSLVDEADRVGTMAARMAVYAVIAAVPILAFTRYWRQLRQGRGALATGFVLYAIAASASVPANLFALYERLGPRLVSALGLRSLPEGSLHFPEYEAVDLTGVAFLDFAVEESFELLGATFLVAGLASVAVGLRSNSGDGPPIPADGNGDRSTDA